MTQKLKKLLLSNKDFILYAIIGGFCTFYPVNNTKNTALYEHYRTLADAIDNVHFFLGGGA